MNCRTVLHVEDDDNDALLLNFAVRRSKLNVSLQRVSDGERAIRYLTGEGEFGDRTRYGFPSLVLLDLKMPGTDGFAVLEWMRSQPGLVNLPVVVLSSSDWAEDLTRARQMGAKDYLIKSDRFEDVIRTIRTQVAGEAPDKVGSQVKTPV
jgi:CheY-like chemotaxis protein